MDVVTGVAANGPGTVEDVGAMEGIEGSDTAGISDRVSALCALLLSAAVCVVVLSPT